MDAAVAAIRHYAQWVADEAHPEFAAHKRANPEFVHPLEGYPLMSAESCVATILAYLAFIVVGSLFMKVVRGNKPFKFLDQLKFFYNPAQSWLAAWLCIEATRQAFLFKDAKIIGNDFVFERPGMALVLYWFYVSKVADFMDTVFIIGGCKWRQLSVLHIYHHCSIYAFYWLLTNVAYDGDIYLTITLNGLIHAIMYGYYWLMSLRLHAPVKVEGPLFDKNKQLVAGSDSTNAREQVVAGKLYSPTWKKYITYAQLTQFTLMNLQGVVLLFVLENPAYPWRIIAAYVVYIQSLFWLFRNFAAKNYGGKKGKKSKKN
jgi:elongation of very long chain fatty acids protein 4